MNSIFICQQCGTKNKEDEVVCHSCNTPLGVTCSSCGKLNPSLLTYCEYCGTSLIKTPLEEMEAADAERIHLNIMFCDLVGSTALSETLDPEVLREIVVEYQEVCAKAIEEQGGYIAQYLGDGILVYFGYPKTYEDNSQRAVQAALNIIENVKALNIKFIKEEKPDIAVRIGIHTGLVVIGEVGGGEKRERLALGDTPNITARIQTLAEPNQILISAETYKIVQKIIYCRERGTHNLKGISAPITVYEPISVELTKSFTTEQTQYAYPPIGREPVIQKLNATWKKVLKGKVQTVILRGDTGTGKTHVMNYFTAAITDKEAKKIFFKCTSYFQNNTLFPFINILYMLIDVDKDESDAVKFSKVESFLKSMHFTLPETVPLVCSLLSIPLSPGYESLSFSAKVITEKTLKFFQNLFFTLSETSPLILIIEDFHYIDRLSLKLFDRLVQSSNHRIFYLLSCRREFNIPLDKSAYHLIDLFALDADSAEKLAIQIAGDKKLPDEILQLIKEKTEGIPLFIEELMNAILESGALELQEDHYILKGPLPESLIPATLQDLLFAKLDQLGKAKEIAQLAAVYGREFTVEMLQVISGLEFEILSQYLKMLVDESILIVKGKLPQIQFSFKQALIQEKAYQLLLISKRLQQHLQIAEALDKNYPAFAKANPEFIANHYTLGEKFIPAAEYWYKAGASSFSHSAFDEAIIYFQKGMELIQRIPEGKQRNSLELMLLSGLAPSLLITKGYTDESVRPAFERAYELVSSVKNPPHLSSVLSGLWAHYTAGGKHDRAYTIANRLKGIALRTKDPFVGFEAGKAMGGNLFWRGEFEQAKKHLDHALKKFNQETQYPHNYQYAEHPVVSMFSYHALTLWMLGDSQKALESSSNALLFAKKINHPFTLVYANGFATLLHQMRGDAVQTKNFAKKTMELSERYGFTSWTETGAIFYRWTIALKNPKKGLKEIEDALSSVRDSGVSLMFSNLLGMLADLYFKRKQYKKAHLSIDQAIHLSVSHKEKFLMAELFFKKACMLQSSHKKNEARKFFKKALGIAEKQQANYFALRAATCLASLNEREADRNKSGELISSLLSEFPGDEKSIEVLNARNQLKKIMAS